MNLLNISQHDFKSVCPKIKYKEDPQKVLYYTPSLPVVKYAKMQNIYNNYLLLKTVEDTCKKLGFILVHSSCIHFRRKKNLHDRQILIKNNSFYALKIEEMTKKEIEKHLNYLEVLTNEFS